MIQYIIPVKGESQSAIILLLLHYLFLSFCVQLKCDENNTKKARFYFIKQKKERWDCKLRAISFDIYDPNVATNSNLNVLSSHVDMA